MAGKTLEICSSFNQIISRIAIYNLQHIAQGRLASLYSVSPEVLPVEPIPKEKVLFDISNLFKGEDTPVVSLQNL